MEGGLRRGRWNKKAPVCTILFLMCMLIPSSTLLQPSEEQTCPPGDYPTEEGICCNKCSPGFKFVEECHAVGQRTKCTPCPAGQYMEKLNFSPNCRSCQSCKASRNEVEVSKCERHQNTICRCKDGYYKSVIDSVTYECRRCEQCGANEKEKQACTPEKNTVCECKEKFYRVNNKCEPCENCFAECKHLCSVTPSNTRAPEPGQDSLLYRIVGFVVVVVVLLALGIFITYRATKWSIKKKLMKSSSQNPEVSQDLSQVLTAYEEPSNNITVNVVSQSPMSEQEQQPSCLPDCVPTIPDLIYSVLDLVPVLQVKQLVRSLGVKDVEIEQAEMDYRSCREARYQMLRLWAERRSPAGGVQHRPLLQELLFELRRMHLGQAAEELETKYGIQ